MEGQQQQFLFVSCRLSVSRLNNLINLANAWSLNAVHHNEGVVIEDIRMLLPGEVVPIFFDMNGNVNGGNAGGANGGDDNAGGGNGGDDNAGGGNAGGGNAGGGNAGVNNAGGNVDEAAGNGGVQEIIDLAGDVGLEGLNGDNDGEEVIEVEQAIPRNWLSVGSNKRRRIF